LPEAGRTPTPQIEKGDSLAYGEAAAANALMHLAPTTSDEDEAVYQPAGDEDEFLYGPTLRPGEPITNGAPFGPGTSAPIGQFRTDADVVKSVAEQIGSSPTASAETKAWAARARAGE
jgi:hypothetical protein